MRITILICFVLFMTMIAVESSAEIAIDTKFPVVGSESNINISNIPDPSSAKLVVIYRPNSATEVKNTAGTFSTGGTIKWVPKNPGIATLLVTDSKGGELIRKNVATRFESAPVTGLLVMFFAGMLLFGGAGYSLTQALKSS